MSWGLARLLLLGLLLAASPAHAAIAVVQATSCEFHGAASCTTPAITSTTGNLFIGSVQTYGSSSFTSITDSKSNTYTDSFPDTLYYNTDLRQQIKVAGTGGSSHTFTLTGIASNYGAISVIEVSGATASPFDKSASTNISASTSWSSGSTATTSQANELLVGWGSSTDAGTTYINDGGAGWTERTNITSDALVVGLISSTKIVSATGAYAYTFTTSPSAWGGIAITTFREQAAATSRQRCVGCGADGKVIE